MFDAVVDFIRNAGLITLTHLLLTAISVLIGCALLFLARTRKEMSFFIAVGILPAVSGILAMFFKYRSSNVGMFAAPGPEAIAVAKREAWIDLSVGLAAAAMILFLRSWRQRVNAKTRWLNKP